MVGTTLTVILVDPAVNIELPRTGRPLPGAVLTSDEVEQIMAGPDLDDPLGLGDRAILELFYSTAIRRTELTNLAVGDIDYARTQLTVRHGKGDKDRVLPLGERAKVWLETYRDQVRPKLVGRRDPGVLFLSSTGAAMSPKKLSDRVGGYVERSGVGKVGACHLFRHTAATLMLEGGADIRYIQAFLGHESLNSTQIYTRVAIGKLADVHAATHPGAPLTSRRAALDALMAEEVEEEECDGAYPLAHKGTGSESVT